MHLFPSRAIALEILGFSVHWYGLLYVAAFIVVLVLFPRLQAKRGLSLTREQILDVVSWAIGGVLIGGRLGFVLLYEPMYYLQHPLRIFAVWEGGMASHGGFIGVGAALLLLSRRRNFDLLALADVITVPAAIGLAFGRIGNFINQELYGTITSLPWGIAIPGVPGVRHPLQIYDALLSLAIAFVCFLCLRRGTPTMRGRICALFLTLYGVMRFSLEFIRDQAGNLPYHLGFLTLTPGQLYTLPLLVLAGVLWSGVLARSEQTRTEPS